MEIKAYKTSDGQIFENKEDYLKYEKKKLIKENISNKISIDGELFEKFRTDPKKALDILKINISIIVEESLEETYNKIQRLNQTSFNIEREEILQKKKSKDEAK